MRTRARARCTQRATTQCPLLPSCCGVFPRTCVPCAGCNPAVPAAGSAAGGARPEAAPAAHACVWRGSSPTGVVQPAQGHAHAGGPRDATAARAAAAAARQGCGQPRLDIRFCRCEHVLVDACVKVVCVCEREGVCLCVRVRVCVCANFLLRVCPCFIF